HSSAFMTYAASSATYTLSLHDALPISKKGGKVEIRFTAEKRQWVFRVRDYGIGISEKGQKHLFKEFYRSDNAVNSEILGSGIGLDRKSTRLNSSHVKISYAVFCLKKKK